MAADTTFPFLRLPPEMRLRVYQYLLLDPPRASLNPLNPYPDILASYVNDDHNIDQEESDESDSSTESEKTYPIPEFARGKKLQRYPAILRTNRQIYNEAVPLLYSKLIMKIEPIDIMTSDTWDGIVDERNNIWRCRPKIPGLEIDHNCGMTMDPPTLAKFERIFLVNTLRCPNADAETELPLWPTLHVDDQFRTSRDGEDAFIACVRGEGTTQRPPVSDIFRQVADVLAKSTYIRRLDIYLDVRVCIWYNDGYYEGNDKEKIRKQIEEWEHRVLAADKRARELVLQAGALDPLKRLENVECLNFDADWLQGETWQGAALEPKPEIARIVRDLKETVESNFAARRGIAQGG